MAESANDPSLEHGRRPRITENYSAYSPPSRVSPLIKRMLDSVPAKYLSGLSEIVLTNASGLPRERRRSVTRSRKRKVKVTGTRGLYHPAQQGHEAWIEIFVDNTLARWEKALWLSIPFMLESLMGDVLFHEIGHHIHFSKRPEYREREDVADVWKVRLERIYNQTSHRYLRFALRLLRFPLRWPIRKLNRIGLHWQFRKGWISRAEFEERLNQMNQRERNQKTRVPLD